MDVLDINPPRNVSTFSESTGFPETGRDDYTPGFFSTMLDRCVFSAANLFNVLDEVRSRVDQNTIDDDGGSNICWAVLSDRR